MKADTAKILILGYGKSGMAAAQLASHLGQHVVVADHKAIAREARLSGVEYLRFSDDAFPALIPEVDEVIVSPGVNPKSALFRWAERHGVPVISELGFAARYAKSPILAITGTNGKTTTTELTTHILLMFGKTVLSAGNIGTAFSDLVRHALVHDAFPDAWICEVSSFQLEKIVAFQPLASALLNISSDHMDRYESFDDYTQTKFKIFNRVPPENCIVHRDLKERFVAQFHAEPMTFSARSTQSDFYLEESTVCFRGRPLVNMRKTRLRGEHNAENIMAAAALVSRIVPDVLTNPDAFAQALASFKLDAHRVEVVAESGNCVYVNDSKATNPDAVIAALKVFGKVRNVRLILGGLDKAMDFTKLQEGASFVLRAYVYGESAARIENALKGYVLCERFEAFDDAVCAAMKSMRSGEVLLLSPACASMDQFTNYRERGDHFRSLVLKTLHESAELPRCSH